MTTKDLIKSLLKKELLNESYTNPLDKDKGLDDKNYIQYNGMFSKNKTSYSYLDDILKDNVYGEKGYHLFYKRKMASIKMMTPQQYLDMVTIGQKSTPEKQEKMISQDQKNKIIKAIENGDKIDMPTLAYDSEGNYAHQEGRHRATIAKERGEKLIPVAIEKTVTDQDLLNKAREIISLANQDLKTNDINKIIDYAKEKFNLHRDVVYYLHKITPDLTIDETIITEKCWKGYTQKGMKTMFGKKYPNCVKKTK